MSAGFDCNLSILVVVLPADRERAKQRITEAVNAVSEKYGVEIEFTDADFEEYAYSDDHPKTAGCISVYLSVSDIYYNPGWSHDADDAMQEWADMILENVKWEFVKEARIYATGYWTERDPDISGSVVWEAS